MLVKKVSIIIPCYNQAEYVKDAILSAINQTYQNIEIVCINDASTDNSGEIIKSFADKYKDILFFENNRNVGVVYTRNFAIDACRGEYILPLDADDTIEPTYVEKAVKILDDNPNIGIVYCKAKLFGNKNMPWDLEDFDKSKILYNNCIFCTALFRKTDFLRAGKYKDYMELGYEDYDLWLSLLELGFDAYRIDEFLFNYRQHSEYSRTTICNKELDKVWSAIIKNHIDLYLKDKCFWGKFFLTDNIKEKHKKYKKLFNILLPIIFVETILLILLTVTFLVYK